MQTLNPTFPSSSLPRPASPHLANQFILSDILHICRHKTLHWLVLYTRPPTTPSHFILDGTYTGVKQSHLQNILCLSRLDSSSAVGELSSALPPYRIMKYHFLCSACRPRYCAPIKGFPTRMAQIRRGQNLSEISRYKRLC